VAMADLESAVGRFFALPGAVMIPNFLPPRRLATTI
jgi:hypothetical protein